MSLLGEGPVTRRRRDGGAWTAGRWVRGAVVDTPFSGSVQRLSGRDRETLGSGDRSREDRKILTLHRGFLRAEDQYATLEADEVITANGVAYTVVHVDDEHPLIPHEHVLLVRTNETSATAQNPDVLGILAEVRAWLIATNAAASVTVPEAGVIFANENGPRPPLPYVTLDVEVYDERVGYDERTVDSSTRTGTRGQRTGTLIVEGFGDGSGDWVERATSRLNTPESLNLLPSVTIEPVGGMTDVSTALDTDTEFRFRRVFSIAYTRVNDVAELEQGVELGQVVHTLDFGGRVITTTEDL